MFRISFSSLTDEKILELAAEKLSGSLEDWEKDIWQFITNWLNPSVDAIKILSSGTTGTPKEIMHSKGCVLNSVRMTCEMLKLKQGNKVLLCLPANRVSGLMMIARSISNKMDLYCVRPTVNPLNQVPDKEKFDFAAFTPSQLYEFDKHFKQIEHIKKILIGGEEVPKRLAKNLTLLSNSVYCAFGMTETLSHIALRRMNGPHPDPYFKTLPGIRVSADESKRLIIHAPELGIRHLQTNDVVHLISLTEFEWLGRNDNLINSGGVKIYPEQIEDQLKALIQVPFFIAGVESPRHGQQVAIAVEKNTVTLKETNEFKRLFENLGKLYSPKTLLTIPHFVRTENGKINRKQSLMHVAMRIAL